MGRIKSFRDLDVWGAAMDLALACYRTTEAFPPIERYTLTAQIRRASVSIPANLAEGHNRGSRKAFRNHVSIALGSQAELDTLLDLARRLDFLTSERLATVESPLRRTGQMLHGLARALKDHAPENLDE